MRLFAILGILMVMGTALVGCRAEGEVGEDEMSTSVVSPR